MGTNYRNVYKSDHLGVVDLEELIENGKPLIFTIKEVKQEIGVAVAGKKGNFNIAYFNEKIKPLVLNATNSKVIRTFAGGSVFVENWKNITVELYIDPNASIGGQKTGGVRIRPVQPKTELPQFTEANFEKAKEANATIELIKSRYTITPEMQTKYLEYVGAKK
jgi:hypothetical protein